MKKIFALLLVAVQLLSMGVFAGDKSSTEGFDSALKDNMELFLSGVEDAPEAFGMENVDFEELQIGQAITPYFADGTLQKDGTQAYYPVFYKKRVVGIFTVIKDESGEMFVNYGKSFANELNEVMKKDKEMVLVYEDSKLKVVTRKGSTILLDQNINKMTKRRSSTEVDYSDKDVHNKMSTVSPFEKITYVSNKKEEGNYRRPLKGKFLKVPRKVQPAGSQLCWAACVASAGQYKTGKEREAEAVARAIGMSSSQPGNTGEMIEAFMTVYGMESFAKYPAISLNSAKEYLEDEKPIIGGFVNDYNTRYRHAMLICGYKLTATPGKAAYYIMDPSNGGYCMASDIGGQMAVSWSDGSKYWMKENCIVNE